MSGETPGRLRLEDVVRMPRPGLNVPTRWQFTPDGTSLTYLYSEGANLVQSLWERRLGSGEARVIAGPPPGTREESALPLEEALRRERLRMRELGVTDYAFARRADPPVLLVPSPEGARVRRGEGELRLLEGTAGCQAPQLSPDGELLAFVRDGELHIASLADGRVIRVTSGAEPGLTHGLAEFIAQEELDRRDGFWWSPDSARIAFEEADCRHIPEFTIVHDEGRRQVIESHRYPFAGEANARVRLGIVEVRERDRTTRWVDPGGDGGDGYLAHVGWRPDGALVVCWLNREQTTLTVRIFSAPDWEGEVLFRETTSPWLNLAHDVQFLRDGSFVRTSERSGFRHVYLHAPDGRVERALTAGEWAVTALLAVDEQGGRVFFQGTREDVRERHIYAVDLEGGAVRRLTPEPGWHSAVFDRAGARFLDTYSSRQRPPVSVVRRARDGEVEEVVFEQPGVDAPSLGLVIPRFVQVTAEDGTELHGAIYEPPGDGAEGASPVIVSVYGGPHAQRVVDDWSLTVDLRAQYLAQNGYLVFKLDNRGSANRGLAFEAHLHRAMGTVEVDDQVQGVRFLASLPGVDTTRVGIYGWSYGGYLTCLALMKAPDVFSVGVAGAPVADWDGYDTGYTERYMGTPAGNPDGYRNASLLTHAARLEGKLLLVHGLVDENVHFRHTVRLVAALTAARKPYELMLFPAERHLPRDAAGLTYMERRLVEFFDRHLKQAE